MLKLIVMFGAAVLLTACAPIGAVVQGDHCAGWSPIFVGVDDYLTEETAVQILGHNEYGIAVNCW